jgi:hypothetical protein
MARPVVKIALTALAISAVSFGATGLLIACNVVSGLPLQESWAWGDLPRCPDGIGDNTDQASRKFAWSGGGLQLAVPGRLRQRAEGPGSVTIHGPAGVLDHVEIEEGRIRFDCSFRGNTPELEIDMVADNVTDFAVQGSGDMILEGLDEERVRISIAGSGSVRATGRVDRVELSIAGSGDADLGGLSAEDVKVSIAGSGDAIVAPEDRLEVSIAGSGDVRLMTDPEDVTSSVFGSGRIIGPARTN